MLIGEICAMDKDKVCLPRASFSCISFLTFRNTRLQSNMPLAMMLMSSCWFSMFAVPVSYLTVSFRWRATTQTISHCTWSSTTNLPLNMSTPVYDPAICLHYLQSLYFLRPQGQCLGVRQRTWRSFVGTDRLFSFKTLIVTRNESCSRFTDGFQPNRISTIRTLQSVLRDCERGEAVFDITFDPDEKKF